MGRMLALAAALVLLGAADTRAQDDPTEAEIFRKRVARYAPAPGKRPKGLCVCQDGSANHGRAGELHQEEVLQVRVTCLVPAFSSNGTFSFFSTCGTFESIAR